MLLHTTRSAIHIIIVSSLVYIFVNLFENIIHYNIGKFSNQKPHFEFPSQSDWPKITIVMCFFALLQGVLTYFIDKL